MQNLSAILPPLPQTAAVNYITQVLGGDSRGWHFWSERKMAMTIRAGLDCHALKISLQLLPVGIPAQCLGVIVNAVCGNGTIN
jgi:hypothetical protein